MLSKLIHSVLLLSAMVAIAGCATHNEPAAAAPRSGPPAFIGAGDFVGRQIYAQQNMAPVTTRVASVPVGE